MWKGSALSVKIVTGPQHGSLSQALDGSVTYKPALNFNGSDSFTYVVNDGELDSAVATVSLTVTAVNDAPIAEDLTLTLREGDTLADALRGSDVDLGENQQLQFALVAEAAHGSVRVNSDGYV